MESDNWSRGSAASESSRCALESAGEEALYCSLSRAAAFAEVSHLISRQPVPINKPLLSYCIRANLGRVIDLSTADAFEALGLNIDSFLGDDLVEAQRIGSAVSWLGYGGLLVPSARANATNLVVYVNRLLPTEFVDLEEAEGSEE